MPVPYPAQFSAMAMYLKPTRSLTRAALLLSAWAIALPSDRNCRGQQPDALASTGWRNGPAVVLLKNNEVFRGEVRVFDSTLELRLDDTASLNLPVSQVAHVGQTAEELYQYLTAQKKEWATGDHTQMCRWCLEQQLFELAVGHYEAVRTAAGDVPQVRQLAAEIKSALLAQPQMQTALGRAGIPQNSGNTVSAQSPDIDVTPSPATPQLVSAGPNLRQARASAVMRLTPAEQDAFRQQIQPVLVQSCARAACHGAFSSNAFPLMDSRRIDSQSAMRHNLEVFSTYAAGHAVAAGDPVELHPLFLKSAAAHGRQLTPPLDITNPQHQRYLEQLRHWLARPSLDQPVAATEDPAAANANAWQIEPTAQAGYQSTGFNEQRLHQNANLRPVASNSAPKIASAGSLAPNGPSLWDQAAKREAAGGRDASGAAIANADGTPAAAFAASEVESLAAAITRLEAVERERSQSGDPLDPEEFNRRFGPK